MDATDQADRPGQKPYAVITALVLLAVAIAQPWPPWAGEQVAEAQTGHPAMSAEAVVREAIEADGDIYAGDCSATISPRDIGKICSKLVDERGDLRAYLVGRTFSEFNRWVFVRRDPDGWRAAGTAPLDFFAPSLAVPWPP